MLLLWFPGNETNGSDDRKTKPTLLSIILLRITRGADLKQKPCTGGEWCPGGVHGEPCQEEDLETVSMNYSRVCVNVHTHTCIYIILCHTMGIKTPQPYSGSSGSLSMA